jgi:hypothetical protein
MQTFFALPASTLSVLKSEVVERFFRNQNAERHPWECGGLARLSRVTHPHKAQERTSVFPHEQKRT